MRIIGERDGWILHALDDGQRGSPTGGWVNYLLVNVAVQKGKRNYQLGYSPGEGRMANGAGWRALCEASADIAQWTLTLIEGDTRNGENGETAKTAPEG